MQESQIIRKKQKFTILAKLASGGASATALTKITAHYGRMDGENLKAKEFLQQYEDQKGIIKSCWEEIAMWKDIALSVTGCTEGERVQTSGSKEKMADAVISYSDIEADIKERIAEAREIQNKIVRTIARLKKHENCVLHGFYILGLQFKEIAAKEGKSVSWATSTHGTALESLQAILDADDKNIEK